MPRQDLAYNHEHDSRPRRYTEKQQYVLDNVISKYKGDAVAAAKGAGYTQPHLAVQSLKEELIEIAQNIIARTAIVAAMTYEEVLNSPVPVPNVKEKLMAAKEVLEHTNPKTQKVDVSGEIKTGIFVLPVKSELSLPKEAIDVETDEV